MLEGFVSPFSAMVVADIEAEMSRIGTICNAFAPQTLTWDVRYFYDSALSKFWHIEAVAVANLGSATGPKGHLCRVSVEGHALGSQKYPPAPFPTVPGGWVAMGGPFHTRDSWPAEHRKGEK